MKAIAIIFAIIAVPAAADAQPPPSYSKQIQPFLAKYCVECHGVTDPDGGLNLATYKDLLIGGDHGAIVAPGKPDESRMLRMVEGKSLPKMPPKKATQPMPEEIALLRTWVAAGAKSDGGGVGVVLPKIAAAKKSPAPITALAYHPGGSLLVAATHRDLALIKTKTGTAEALDLDLPGKATAVAFSRDGKQFALAFGDPGAVATVMLFDCEADGSPGAVPFHSIAAHTDTIHALAFSPDGKQLASCGYDRAVRLWDVSTGKPIYRLRDHSDAVYGLAFSPDGKLLATVAADRAVKIWDLENGTRLYTLGESTDWLYAVAWSPDGKHVAAAGVDRSIRIWEVNRTAGRVVHSAFAHEGPVVAIAYSADGKTLYSLSEDRRAKSWDAAKMLERKLYDAQADTPLALAVRSDQLAIGRFDGALVLLDEKTGKTQAQPLPIKPKPPALKSLKPNSGPRGKAIRILVEADARGQVDLVSTHRGFVAIPVVDAQLQPGQHRFEVSFPPDNPAGEYPLMLRNHDGESAKLPFTVDLFEAKQEVEPNASPRTGQLITLPVTMIGSLDRAGEVDYFRFEVRAGRQVGVQIVVPPMPKLEPVLHLVGPDGRVLIESSNGSLGHTIPTDGTYALGVRDREYRGGLSYRLHIGDVPVVTSVFPLGLRRGSEMDVAVEGVHLAKVNSVRVKVPADAAIGSRVPVSIMTPLGPPQGAPSVVVGEFPDVVLADGKLSVDSTANGVIASAGATNTWQFSAKKGERLLLDVNARRIGSPLDSTIEILDAKGNPLPRAVLRSVSKTYSTFRDHDSVGAGIRIETWTELAVNDYLWLGSELLRIRALPKNPDDDCQFFSEGGRREGFLGTTPGQVSLGTPMYKVAIHPPGSTFPPNGLPLITLFHRNDDGGAVFTKDSHLTFDPPADGEYQVRIGDARGEGSSRHAYRLTLRRPRPDFSVSFTPTAPAVWSNGGVPITVNVNRIDGFDGEITAQLENLPAWLQAPVTNVPAGETSTTSVLYATGTPPPGAKPGPVKILATARIDGKEIRRESAGAVPTIAPAGDIVTSTLQSEVTLRPGGTTKLAVKIDRLNGFKGRVPVEVRGLPHGVRVLDIGLNGILITPTETTRTMEIYCEPWVTPIEHPFVVLAKIEGKNSEHAARPVLLRVVK